MSQEKIPVGISACLLGHEVRHDGGHKRDAYITGTLAQWFEFRPFCPEVGAGLGVPRPTIRLVETPRGVRALGVRDPDLDVTERLEAYARRQSAELSALSGFIFKRASPSCGMERVKVYRERGGAPAAKGEGIFAAWVRSQFPELPTEEEGRLGDARLRENFLERVFVYHHWRTVVAPQLSVEALTRFHARLKLTLMSHHPQRARALGRLAASAREDNLAEVAERYFREAMATLRVLATRGKHVNVLQHIQGHLKRRLSADDRAELAQVIAAYGAGEVPLIVPITLFVHHFRKAPDPWILDSWYLSPYPAALGLRNLL
ncbi:MAG: hypothetical protein KatS3mg124_1247 [Porticoccaceae bacterium]|nr:MAG: hypothetical protein KatS3mg124_1247 [Porticoccaceae bacterium]